MTKGIRQKVISVLAVLILLLLPLAAFSEEAENDAALRARETVNGMTLHEMVCQMFITAPEEITGEQRTTVLPDNAKEAYENDPYGGVLIYGKNIVTEEQLGALCASAASLAYSPFVIAQEAGGADAAVSGKLYSADRDSMRTLAAGKDVSRIYIEGEKIGEYLSGFGFNMDLAPSADLYGPEQDSVLDSRFFSSSAAENAAYVWQYALGLTENGIIPVLGFFPGLGDSTGDPWHSRTVIDTDEDELYTVDMLPFRLAAAAGMPCIRVTCAEYSALEKDVPACFSKRTVTGILRQEFGFDGIIMTDLMNVRTVTDRYQAGEAAVKAVQAGCDMILMSANTGKAVKALEDSVKNGEIPESRIRESAERIIRLKISRGILER